MPKSSSPSPTITPMNKTHPQTLTLTPPPPPTLIPNPPPQDDDNEDDDDDLLHLQSYPQSLLMDEEDDPEPNLNLYPSQSSIPNPNPNPNSDQSTFSSLLFCEPNDEEEEEEEEEAADEDDDEIEGNDDHKPALNGHAVPAADPPAAAAAPVPVPVPPAPHIDPSSHISSQFYTFNRDSHALMVRCILEGRLATPDEIRGATPAPVLKSWRSVWKDRNEDTAYLTAWKRIQDKLAAHLDAVPAPGSLPVLFFKNNPAQSVSHVDQWQDIVTAAHADPDLLRHLGLKETVDRIKKSWTVGAKFYGIPESFIRVCVASCPVCTSSSSAVSAGGASIAARSKRRRFEYTESFDVPAKDVPRQLQQLAAKHKVVLCIRQKYIRYKPFMAEVKDYACHRAGEPSSASASSKKARVLKREPYQSKRCGCGFRIRAIVPIANYNEKDKTFVYQDEGTAVFKLYAVHSGHEPGPLDGNARIIHRVVGQKGGFDLDPVDYGVREEAEPESFVNLTGKEDCGDPHHMVLQLVQELRVEAGFLEGKIAKMPPEMLGSLAHNLVDILHRLRNVAVTQHSEESLVVGNEELGQWGHDGNHHLDSHDRIFAKDAEMIDEEENDFDSTLGAIVPWDRMSVECQDRKLLMREGLKSDKWMMKEDCGDFDEKSILNCGEDEDSKLIKPLRNDGTIVPDRNLLGMQVDGFYPDTTKWYDSPSGLDPGADSGDGGFRHGGIV
ncbi:uncharacterized protein LOC103713382 [Phoenix dactylifera]|uniref:Uncharacterized protein LOC103713382 n=1 Tax=Phoenix dactylifera TaxID=42345 RepID=A0A8B7CGH4_PHODC|nr:uncharacterized protein LOC103713382 [Phoenix dactylifera]